MENNDVPSPEEEWLDSPDSQQEPDTNQVRKPWEPKGGRRPQYTPNDDGRSNRLPDQQKDQWVDQDPRQVSLAM